MVDIYIRHCVLCCCILVCLICCMGSASAGCVFTMDPTLGAIFCHRFLSPAHKERPEHWAHGIKDTEKLDILNDVGIY